MNKKLLIFLLAMGVALIFLATGLQAGTKVADTFKMQTKELKTRKKGLVTFNHKKHNTDYDLSCGECHHDKDHKALTNLKMGDDVKRCIECHTKIKGSGKDILVLKNAMHKNCIGCHKKFNKKKTGNARKGPAPASCSKCHPKKKK